MSFSKSHVLMEEKTPTGTSRYLLVHDEKLNTTHFERIVYVITDPFYISWIQKSCNKIYVKNNIMYSGVIASGSFGEKFYDKYYKTFVCNNYNGNDINNIINPVCIKCGGIDAFGQCGFSSIPIYTKMSASQQATSMLTTPTQQQYYSLSQYNPGSRHRRLFNTYASPNITSTIPTYSYTHQPYQSPRRASRRQNSIRDNLSSVRITTFRTVPKQDSIASKPTATPQPKFKDKYIPISSRNLSSKPCKAKATGQIDYDEELKTYKILEGTARRRLRIQAINKLIINSPKYGPVKQSEFPDEIDLDDYIVTEDVDTDDYYEESLKRAIEGSMSDEQKAEKYIDSMKDIVSAYSIATTITFKYNAKCKSYEYDLKMTDNDIPEDELYKCPICMEIINTSLVNKKNKDGKFIIVSPCECNGTEGLMHRSCYMECIKNEVVECKIYCRKPFTVPSIIDMSTYRILLESYRHLLK
jgi:hypothetical protein